MFPTPDVKMMYMCYLCNYVWTLYGRWRWHQTNRVRKQGKETKTKEVKWKNEEKKWCILRMYSMPAARTSQTGALLPPSDVTAAGKLCLDRSKVMHVMSGRERSRKTSTILAVNRGQGKPYIPSPLLTSPGLTPTLVITYLTNLIITLNSITFTLPHHTHSSFHTNHPLHLRPLPNAFPHPLPLYSTSFLQSCWLGAVGIRMWFSCSPTTGSDFSFWFRRRRQARAVEDFAERGQWVVGGYFA